MEGRLSTASDHDGDDDASSSSTRRRVLKASAALTTTGIVGGSGFVGQAAADHRAAINCPGSVQSDGTVVFSSQTVGDTIAYRGSPSCGPDSVVIDRVEATCEGSSWVDLHDPTSKTGPCGTKEFAAGYPVGASTLFAQGTYTNMTIPLFDCPPGTCLEWNRTEWVNDQNPQGTREMCAMLHLDAPSDGEINHYEMHDGPAAPPDPAYLNHGDTSTFPVQTCRTVYGDGKG